MVIEMWDVSFCVDRCPDCRAMPDVECTPECDNHDFRQAEFDGILEAEGEE